MLRSLVFVFIILIWLARARLYNTRVMTLQRKLLIGKSSVATLLQRVDKIMAEFPNANSESGFRVEAIKT